MCLTRPAVVAIFRAFTVHRRLLAAMSPTRQPLPPWREGDRQCGVGAVPRRIGHAGCTAWARWRAYWERDEAYGAVRHRRRHDVAARGVRRVGTGTACLIGTGGSSVVWRRRGPDCRCRGAAGRRARCHERAGRQAREQAGPGRSGSAGRRPGCCRCRHREGGRLVPRGRQDGDHRHGDQDRLLADLLRSPGRLEGAERRLRRLLQDAQRAGRGQRSQDHLDPVRRWLRSLADAGRREEADRGRQGLRAGRGAGHAEQPGGDAVRAGEEGAQLLPPDRLQSLVHAPQPHVLRALHQLHGRRHAAGRVRDQGDEREEDRHALSRTMRSGARGPTGSRRRSRSWAASRSSRSASSRRTPTTARPS